MLGAAPKGTISFCGPREEEPGELNLLLRKKDPKSSGMLGLVSPSIYLIVGIAAVLLPLIFLPYGSRTETSPWMIVLTIIRIFVLLLLLLFSCLGFLGSFEPGQGHIYYRLVFGVLALMSLGSMIFGLCSLVKK